MSPTSCKEIDSHTAAIHLFCSILDSWEWTKYCLFSCWCRLSEFAQPQIQLCLAGWGWNLVFLNISDCHSETHRRDQLSGFPFHAGEQKHRWHARSSRGKSNNCNNHSFFIMVPTPPPSKLMVNLSLTPRVQSLTQSQCQCLRLRPLSARCRSCLSGLNFYQLWWNFHNFHLFQEQIWSECRICIKWVSSLCYSCSLLSALWCFPLIVPLLIECCIITKTKEKCLLETNQQSYDRPLNKE